MHVYVLEQADLESRNAYAAPCTIGVYATAEAARTAALARWDDDHLDDNGDVDCSARIEFGVGWGEATVFVLGGDIDDNLFAYVCTKHEVA